MNQYQMNAAMCYPQRMSLAAMPMMTAIQPAAAAAAMPLAMAYVPMQSWNQTYEPAVGLMRGTIFPELDLPFLGGRRCCK